MSAQTTVDAEHAARALLDQGADYNEVVGMIPPQMQSFVAAKLPRRLPTSSSAMPMPNFFPGVPMGTPGLNGSPVAPSLFTPPHTSLPPMFSPPGT